MASTLSIITPSFNQAKYLEQTLRSVISQRKWVDQFVVLDGGSTDGSVDIIRKYAGQIDYWKSEKDKGQADAIAQGFAIATGDWIAWLNSDDLYLPGAIEKIKTAIDAHPEWDALTGWHVRIDAESRVTSAHQIPGESPAQSRWGMTHVNQQTCFFKRSLYEKVGPIRQDLHCVLDTELWFRFFDAGATWGHIPDYLAAFRVHAAAKGSAWLETYAREFKWLDAHYPRYHGRQLKHYLGRAWHKLGQIVSGREAGGKKDAAKWNGKEVESVFGRYTLGDLT